MEIIFIFFKYNTTFDQSYTNVVLKMTVFFQHGRTINQYVFSRILFFAVWVPKKILGVFLNTFLVQLILKKVAIFRFDYIVYIQGESLTHKRILTANCTQKTNDFF